MISLKKVLLSAVLLVASVEARDVVDNSNTCRINWTKGYITCLGQSAEGQSRYDATTVSEVEAKANLLEVIKGVKIDSVTTVEKQLKTSRRITSRVSGVIRGAEVIANKYYKKDGYAIAQVRIYMGKDLLKALLSDPTKLTWNEKVKDFFANFSFATSAYASTYNSQDKETLNKLLQDLEKRGDKKAASYVKNTLASINDIKYSGILIDVSEIDNFEKAMIVKLVDEDGEEFYPAKRITKETLTRRNTSVGYMFGFNDARNNQRVYSVPLELKATQVYKNKRSNIILSKAQIKEISALESKVFTKAKIILVLGD